MPNENKNILIQIREMRSSLTPISQRLADYILKNPQEVTTLSIKSLAQKSRTSDAAVMRFCKSMGAEGYRSLIVSISAAVGAMNESQPTMTFSDIYPGDDIHSIILKISGSNHQSIDDTLSILKESAVEQAVELMLNARKIIFCGMGASAIVCVDAEQKFMRINKSCAAYTDGHGQLTAAVLLEAEDVAVLVSNSGETMDILDTLEVLRARNIPTIAITRYGKNTLSTLADVVLDISTPELIIRSGAMGSRIAMLNIVDILYAGVVGRDYERCTSCLARTRKAIDIKQR